MPERDQYLDEAAETREHDDRYAEGERGRNDENMDTRARYPEDDERGRYGESLDSRDESLDSRDDDERYAEGERERGRYGETTGVRGQDDSLTAGSSHGTGTDSTSTMALVEGSGELFERWQRVQSAFVDSPRESVHEAGAIVEDVLGRLSRTFNDERQRLDQAWDAGEEPSTEELRIALRRYREFFERLLAA